ncbi:MAG: hypothetical protein JNL67_20440 [Planctomycetaceae bacterium]|nr:hypothetical protein [Planctomycetaceae bacterium]
MSKWPLRASPACLADSYKTQGRDNDLWDVIIGCHVGASMQGIQLEVSAGGKPPAPKTKRSKSYVTPLGM